MKIIAVKIENLQSIVGPETFILSPDITNISGPNAAGKSTVLRALRLFSDTFSREDIKSLRPRRKRKAKIKVELLLENMTTLTAEIEGNLIPKYYIKDLQGQTLQYWNSYDRDIERYLGWKITDNNKLYLNLKKSKFNIGVDTNPRDMAEIIEYISRDQNLENRILNTEYMYKVQKDILIAIDKEKSLTESRLRAIPDIDFNSTLDKANNLNNTYTWIYYTRILKSCLVSHTQISNINKELNILNKLISLNTKLANISSIYTHTQKTIHLTNNLKKLNKLQEIIDFSNKSKLNTSLKIKAELLKKHKKVSLGIHNPVLSGAIKSSKLFLEIIRKHRENGTFIVVLSSVFSASGAFRNFKNKVDLLNKKNKIGTFSDIKNKIHTATICNTKIQEIYQNKLKISNIKTNINKQSNIIHKITKYTLITNINKYLQYTIKENYLQQEINNIKTVKCIHCGNETPI